MHDFSKIVAPRIGYEGEMADIPNAIVAAIDQLEQERDDAEAMVADSLRGQLNELRNELDAENAKSQQCIASMHCIS